MVLCSPGLALSQAAVLGPDSPDAEPWSSSPPDQVDDGPDAVSCYQLDDGPDAGPVILVLFLSFLRHWDAGELCG